jgi:hypothetical protein
MAVLIVTGVVTRSGTGEYGDWYVIAETAHKKDGTPYTKRYMCSGKDRPAEGERVVVQGFAYAKVTERDGQHYADININGAQFTRLEAEAHQAPPQQEYAEDSIPF